MAKEKNTWFWLRLCALALSAPERARPLYHQAARLVLTPGSPLYDPALDLLRPRGRHRKRRHRQFIGRFPFLGLLSPREKR